jgi:phage gp29-like protein
MTYAKPKRISKKSSSGLTVLGNQSAQFDRWRQQFNPLRNLTIARAVSLFDASQRGEFADLQWTYRFIERRDEDLIALMERRGSAILQMDWNIKIVDEDTAVRRGIAFDESLAEDQARALRSAYERIKNLYVAIEHLAMAAFREFAICQLQDGDRAAAPGEANHIECLNGWNIVRDGLSGDWYWNAEARQVPVQSLSAADRIDPEFCLIREWPRPLDEIALLKFIRSNLSRKNWDAFVEIYGLPAWIVIMPPSVPSGKEAEYLAAARAIAEGQPGALPPGSDAKCADQPRGVNPFRDHLQYLTEKLVLAGTGGLLTMLSAPGSGTLAGSAHMEAFNIVARGEARKISEIFQAQFDARVLASGFEGKPTLAYFELAANEEQDVGEILDHAVKIKQAGGQVDWEEMSEKTGYTLTAAPEPAPSFFPGQPTDLSAAIRNRFESAAADLAESARNRLVEQAVTETSSAQDAMVGSWFASFEALTARTDLTPAQFLDEAEYMVKNMPTALMTRENVKRLAAIAEGTMGAAVVNAVLASQKGDHP